jgi:hypothetical protein
VDIAAVARHGCLVLISLGPGIFVFLLCPAAFGLGLFLAVLSSASCWQRINLNGSVQQARSLRMPAKIKTSEEVYNAFKTEPIGK